MGKIFVYVYPTLHLSLENAIELCPVGCIEVRSFFHQLAKHVHVENTELKTKQVMGAL